MAIAEIAQPVAQTSSAMGQSLYIYTAGGISLAALLAWLWRKNNKKSVNRTLVVWRMHSVEFIPVPDSAINVLKTKKGTYTLSSDSRAWRSSVNGSGTYSIYLGNSTSPIVLTDKGVDESRMDITETRAILDSELAKEAALAKRSTSVNPKKIMEWLLWAGGITAVIAILHMTHIININQILGLGG